MRVFPGDTTEGLIGGLDPSLNYLFSISTSFNVNGIIYEGERSHFIEPTSTLSATFRATSTTLIQSPSPTINKPPQEKVWLTSPWSRCFPDCHRGVRNRTVTCMTASTRMIVDSCSSPPPSSIELCHKRGPCTQWIVESWSSCSKSCGAGYQVRRITCQTTYDNIVLDDTQCLTKRPPVFRYCFEQECPCTQSSFCEIIANTELCSRAEYQRDCHCTCGPHEL
ncbi:PREDICTED: A disintegrin and metalloproteinase with thrombospondin motifs 17-like [Amphimedon queenslandica]|uniref:Uncharacterized protein n=1 Tax=Amphimedon queenslandica TaxID=400682 RepID=A0AAN0J357_AMPQE|nr:PREDICTED: A disintegrin and metalloproteinase with thrombospondin motifs 17-like [Amphimedon queenslandica]|eukprot:XP_019851156.1 PREDICTED: A disintegrin and metalloproteinase with thrombospondin motifs 17-like [Amphimedon queenslandica]